MTSFLVHLKIELAIALNIHPEGEFSDEALLAIKNAKSVILQPDWLDYVFSLETVKKSVADICA
mgnify:CR=1 FL=1